MQVGDVAPEFALKDQGGKTVKLSQFKGKKVRLCPCVWCASANKLLASDAGSPGFINT
jgi:hypothetical protein